MIIYKDVISNDELFSDSYVIKVIDDFFYDIEGEFKTENIGDFSDAIGANPSADEAGDDTESSSITGINIVINHRLAPTGFSKSSYKTYIKGYMKSVLQYLEKHDKARADIFKTKAPSKIKEILNQFEQYEFYLGESNNPEGCVMLLNYREDGNTPYFLVFKDAVIAEKY